MVAGADTGFRDRFAAAFASGARGLNLEAQLEHLPQFLVLAEEVLARNAKAGLTRLVRPEEMAVKHFLDSLSCLLSPCWGAPDKAVDVGSGAGFPGLVLAVAAPECSFVLVEASRKKAAFLRHAAARLGVQVEVVEARAEGYARAPAARERFGLGLSRAAAKLPATLEYVIPLLSCGGRFIAQLGPGDGLALEDYAGRPESGDVDGTPAWEVLGARLAALTRVSLPAGTGERWLTCFCKVRPTPDAFPRRAGVPTRRPLPLFGR